MSHAANMARLPLAWMYTRRAENVDAGTIQTAGATAVPLLVCFAGYLQIVKGKKLDAEQAESMKRIDVTEKGLERQAAEIVENHRRMNDMQAELDKARTHGFEFEKKLNDLQIETDNKIATLQRSSTEQSDLYEEKIRLLKEQIKLLESENVRLKEQLAEAASIGIVERRHGERLSRGVDAPQRVEVVNSQAHPVPVVTNGNEREDA